MTVAAVAAMEAATTAVITTATATATVATAKAKAAAVAAAAAAAADPLEYAHRAGCHRSGNRLNPVLNQPDIRARRVDLHTRLGHLCAHERER